MEHSDDSRDPAYADRLSAFAANLVDMEDAERRELAGELHDGVSQALAVAMMRLRVQMRERGGSGATEMKEIESLLSSAIQETRLITARLSPPGLHELGLAAAVHWLCDWTERTQGLRCVVAVVPEVDQLDETTSRILFRGIRELLANVVKHAGATRATVTLTGTADGVEITVNDDGRGFDVAETTEGRAPGFGLFGIQESLRQVGGELDVASAPGDGTQVTIRVPRRT